MKTKLLIILMLLLTASAASADWILYRSRDGSANGGWIATGTYQDLKVCEAAAKEMADTQKTYAGCAAPIFAAPQGQPPSAEDQKGPATKQWEESEAARAKKKADAAQRQKEAREKMCSEIVTECQTYRGGRPATVSHGAEP